MDFFAVKVDGSDVIAGRLQIFKIPTDVLRTLNKGSFSIVYSVEYKSSILILVVYPVHP